jgi:hypothetical protein
MSHELRPSELTELSNIELGSELFGKKMTIKDFTKNIFAFNDGDFPKIKDAFDRDLRSIMAIFIGKGYFSEHSFRTAEKVFFGICDLNNWER